MVETETERSKIESQWRATLQSMWPWSIGFMILQLVLAVYSAWRHEQRVNSDPSSTPKDKQLAHQQTQSVAYNLLNYTSGLLATPQSVMSTVSQGLLQSVLPRQTQYGYSNGNGFLPGNCNGIPHGNGMLPGNWNGIPHPNANGMLHGNGMLHLPAQYGMLPLPAHTPHAPQGPQGSGQHSQEGAQNGGQADGTGEGDTTQPKAKKTQERKQCEGIVNGQRCPNDKAGLKYCTEHKNGQKTDAKKGGAKTKQTEKANAHAEEASAQRDKRKANEKPEGEPEAKRIDDTDRMQHSA